MKKFQTFMNNMTKVQGLILAFIIGLIVNVVFLTLTLEDFTLLFNQPLLTIIISQGIWTLGSYTLISISFIEPREEREAFDEEFEMAKEEVLAEFNLTKDSYTEVNFIFEKLFTDVDEDLTYVILPLLNNSNYRFFAKLIDSEEEEEIALLVKDINDNVIHSLIIGNFIYFQNNFEKLN